MQTRGLACRLLLFVFEAKQFHLNACRLAFTLYSLVSPLPAAFYLTCHIYASLPDPSWCLVHTLHVAVKLITCCTRPKSRPCCFLAGSYSISEWPFVFEVSLMQRNRYIFAYGLKYRHTHGDGSKIPGMHWQTGVFITELKGPPAKLPSTYLEVLETEVTLCYCESRGWTRLEEG